MLVVGAGPAGLTAALRLARDGVEVMVIDSADGPGTASRAKGIQPRTLEAFDRLGIVDPVLAAGGPFPRWRRYASGQVAWEKSIYELLGIGDPVVSAEVPYPETWMVAHWRTDAILREAVAGYGVDVEFGCRLSDIEVDDGGVVATVGAAGTRVAGRGSRRRISCLPTAPRARCASCSGCPSTG